MDIRSRMGHIDQRVFTPRGMDPAALDPRALYATYQGPGRDTVLGLGEKLGILPKGTADAARAGATPEELGQAMAGVVGGTPAEATLGMTAGEQAASGAAGVGSHGGVGSYAIGGGITSNPVHGGLMAQAVQMQLAQQTGLPVAGYTLPKEAAEAAAAAAGDGAGAAGADRVAAAAAAGTDDAASFVAEALQMIDNSPPPLREAAIDATVERLVQSGVIEQVVADGEPEDVAKLRAMLEAPPDQVAPSLRETLEAIVGAQTPAAAEEVAHAAEAAAPAAEHAAAAAHVAAPVVEAEHAAAAVAGRLQSVHEILRAAPQLAGAYDEIQAVLRFLPRVV